MQLSLQWLQLTSWLNWWSAAPVSRRSRVRIQYKHGFFSGFLFVTAGVASVTAMVFFHIILRLAVHDFHLFTTSMHDIIITLFDYLLGAEGSVRRYTNIFVTRQVTKTRARQTGPRLKNLVEELYIPRCWQLTFHLIKARFFLLSTVEAYRKQVNLERRAIIGVATDDVALPTHDKQKSSKSSSHSMNAGTAAGITFGVTALAGLLIAVMVIGWRRHKSVNRESNDLREPLSSLGNYGAVHDEGSPRVWFSTKSGYRVPFSLFLQTLIIKQRITRQAWK